MSTWTPETELANSRSETVAQVMGKDVTRGDLCEAFAGVTNVDHWKKPINAVIDLDDRGMAMVREAVVFFTGSVPSFSPMLGARLPKCRYRVQAAGYYATIGA
jgi:hypothetical protein